MCIVIFDRNPQSLKVTCEILKKNGYFEVFSSSVASDLISSLKMQEPSDYSIPFSVDLFIIDITEDIKILELIEQCKAYNRFRDIPVLVSSSADFEKNMVLAYGLGANDFFKNPLVEIELVSRVRSSLRLYNEISKRKAREKELVEVTNQLRDMNQILTKLSLVDSLTKIPNRRAFDQTFEMECKRSKRSKSPFSLAIFDVDFFKQYNDHYGHQKGDETLYKIANLAQTAIKRPGDLVARYGGEEFAIILPNTPLEGASVIGNRLVEAIESDKIIHEKSSISEFMTVSVGIACADFANNFSDTKSENYKKIISIADKALYEAKKRGRNQIVADYVEPLKKSIA